MTAIDRKTYIGSSDAGDLFRGDWYSVWRQKTGRDQPVDLSNVFRVQLGRVTEAFHLDWTIREAALEAGETFTRHMLEDSNGPIMHNDFIGARPDERIDTSHGVACVEVKHTNARSSLDLMLERYMPQIQHHMLCTGDDRLLFSFIPGNDDPVRAWISASPAWATALEDTYTAFWDLVKSDSPPAKNADPVMDEAAMKQMVDKTPIDGMVARDATTDNAFQNLAVQFIKTKDAHKMHDDAKKQLKALVGSNEREVYSNLLTLKRNKRGAIGMTIEPGAASELGLPEGVS